MTSNGGQVSRMSRKQRILIAIIFLLGILLVVGPVAYLMIVKPFDNLVTVENQAEVPITNLTVVISNSVVVSDQLHFNDLAPNRQVSASYNPQGDSSFYISGTLADGTPIDGNFGYTTHGTFGERTIIIIHHDGEIDFEQSWN